MRKENSAELKDSDWAPPNPAAVREPTPTTRRLRSHSYTGDEGHDPKTDTVVNNPSGALAPHIVTKDTIKELQESLSKMTLRPQRSVKEKQFTEKQIRKL